MTSLAAFNSEGYLYEEDRAMLQYSAISTRHLPGEIVEVGTLYGLSTSVILSASNPKKKMFCVDPVTTTEMLEPSVNKVGGMHGRGVTLLSYFVESPDLPDLLPQQISMAFLDHNHEYDTTVLGLALLWKRIVPHGMLIVHDFRHEDYPGGTKACLEFIEKHSDIKTIRLQGGCVCMQKAHG